MGAAQSGEPAVTWMVTRLVRPSATTRTSPSMEPPSSMATMLADVVLQQAQCGGGRVPDCRSQRLETGAGVADQDRGGSRVGLVPLQGDEERRRASEQQRDDDEGPTRRGTPRTTFLAARWSGKPTAKGWQSNRGPGSHGPCPDPFEPARQDVLRVQPPDPAGHARNPANPCDDRLGVLGAMRP